MKPKPTGALVERSLVGFHPHFDSTPFSSLSLVDVARILDIETAKTKLDVDTLGKLIDRVLSGLVHTIIATSGRSQGTRLARLLQRGFNRLLTRLPEFAPDLAATNESLGRLHQVFKIIETPIGAPTDPLDEKLVLANYSEYSRLVADAYDARPVHDPAARASYAALLRHNYKMFKHILARVQVVFGADTLADYELGKSGGPYKDAADMTRRVKETGILHVNTDFSENLASGWSQKDNWVFRAVHDYVVHIGGHHDFSLRGEIGTYNRHAKLAPPAALPALFGEVVGQAAYAIVRGRFPSPQKACVLYGFDYKAVGRVDLAGYKMNWTSGL